ncbi:MAG: M67 family metallopeptidase [Peptococcaceae bacterium]|nr:M67 family metallopeptidase [Peptococcaceae bacterium]
MIVLKKQQYEEILSHSLRALPNEACGLLGGKIDDDMKVVEKVYLLTNTDQSPEHFSMDPKEQFAAVKDMRKSGWIILGNFHSHPESPSRPSEEDKRLAYDPEISYLILSLMDKDNPVLKGFRIRRENIDEEQILVQGED